MGEVMDAEAEPVEPVEHELMSRLHHLYILYNYSVYILLYITYKCIYIYSVYI